MEAEQENNGDQNLLRNDLGDNRGTKIKREIPQLLIFNELRDSTVPRTGLEPARLSARAPETRASTIPPPGHRVLVTQRYGVFLYCASQSAIFSFFIVREIGFYSKRQSVLIVRGCRFWLYGEFVCVVWGDVW